MRERLHSHAPHLRDVDRDESDSNMPFIVLGIALIALWVGVIGASYLVARWL